MKNLIGNIGLSVILLPLAGCGGSDDLSAAEKEEQEIRQELEQLDRNVDR